MLVIAGKLIFHTNFANKFWINFEGYMTYETISLIANVALTLSFIVALVFGIAQVRLAKRDRRERFTLETLRTFQTREFAELISFVSLHPTPSSFKELNSLPFDEQAKFIQLAQEMESLGILVADRLIDIDLVDKTLGSFVTTAWQKYKIVFEDIRQNQPDPFLGEYFQWLAEYIDDRMQNHPRQPFFETHKPASRRT
jgi:hypothetical protein